MSENIQTIVVPYLISRYNENPEMFSSLPEFSFIVPLAKESKEKGCTCGMGSRIQEATTAFNVIVQSLNEEQVIRIKGVLGVSDQICFGIQAADSFSVRCY